MNMVEAKSCPPRVDTTSLAGLFILVVAITGLSATLAVAGACGSSWRQKIGTPDYACFSSTGKILPCTVAGLGTTPVYYGYACQAHDDCYATNGQAKAGCDRILLQFMKASCDESLGRSSDRKARKQCYNVASAYHAAVAALGCKPFLKAQKSAGNADARC
jgi:hypothetical protein